MKLTLKIWRQASASADGAMHTYELDGVSSDMSFLEMLDLLNEQLVTSGEEPVAFDSDCREGICGMCSLMINGQAHGPEVTTTCQLHMRSFTDGETITIEPWRASSFPVVKDLVWIAPRSTGSSRTAATSPPTPAQRPRPTRCRRRATRRCGPSTWPPASAAAHV